MSIYTTVRAWLCVIVCPKVDHFLSHCAADSSTRTFYGFCVGHRLQLRTVNCSNLKNINCVSVRKIFIYYEQYQRKHKQKTVTCQEKFGFILPIVN